MFDVGEGLIDDFVALNLGEAIFAAVVLLATKIVLANGSNDMRLNP